MTGSSETVRAIAGIEDLKSRLSHREPSVVAGDRRAAVAAVLSFVAPDEPRVLMIHRAEDERDPWSGHMAFPGGRVEDADASPEAAARRETEEEVGLNLERDAIPLGRLSDVTAVARGRRLGLVIEPFIFAVTRRVALRLNSEVQESLWVPLSFFVGLGNRSSLTYDYEGRSIELPCYHYRGKLIWGLTLRMLDEMLEVVAGAESDDWPQRE